MRITWCCLSISWKNYAIKYLQADTFHNLEIKPFTKVLKFINEARTLIGYGSEASIASNRSTDTSNADQGIEQRLIKLYP